MKREIIGIFLLVLAVSLAVASVAVTRDISQNILQSVEQAEACIRNGDKAGAAAAAAELTDSWEKQYKILSSYIPHEHLERCEIAMSSAKKHLELDNSEMALIQCEEIRVAAQHIYISERPALWNIF